MNQITIEIVPNSASILDIRILLTTIAFQAAHSCVFQFHFIIPVEHEDDWGPLPDSSSFFRMKECFFFFIVL